MAFAISLHIVVNNLIILINLCFSLRAIQGEIDDRWDILESDVLNL